VKALFDGADHCEIETQVKFEDGRSGVISADVKIRNVALVQANEQRKAA
jgi:long-chain acyl-CoA synthetase